MAESIRNQILSALHTKLGAIAGIRFDRSRTPPRNDEDGSVVGNIRPAMAPYNETIENPGGHYQVRRKLPVDIRIVAQGDVPDAVADPFCVEVVKAIAADQRLGGLVNRIYEIDRHWLFSGPDEPADYVEVAMIFEIDYITRRDDESLAQ